MSARSAGPTGSRPSLASFATNPGTVLFLVATVLAVVVTFPVVLHFGDTIYGTPGDATGGVTEFWWWGYALLHSKSIFDNTLEGVPLGSEWSLMPFTVLPLVIFTPLSILIGPIASYNLLILSGFPLTAWATFLLVRRLGFPPLAAAFAALAFAFSPYHVEKAQGHGYETHMEFIALTFYFLVRWRESGRRRDAVLAGVMVGLQLWMDYSLSYVLAFGLVAFFLVSALVPIKDVARNVWLMRNVVAGTVMTVVAALFVPLMLLTAHRPGTGSLGGALTNVQRSLGELQIYSARLYEFIEPWHANPLVPGWLVQWEDAHLHGSNWAESSLLLGYIVIAMALAGLLLNRQRFPTAFSLGLVVIALALAAPPIAHVFGIPIQTPSYYLFKLVAFFRVYARFSILVMLGTCVLAAGGFAALQSRLGAGRRQLLLLPAFLVLAVEFNNMPPSHVTKILPAPPVYTWLAAQPQGILLEYPAHSGQPIVLEVQVRQYELYQMVHLHPTFLNESPINGVVADAAAQLEPYYAPGVAGRMKAYGVRYVFVHRADYSAIGWQLPKVAPGLSYVDTIGDVDVYTVD